MKSLYFVIGFLFGLIMGAAFQYPMIRYFPWPIPQLIERAEDWTCEVLPLPPP